MLRMTRLLSILIFFSFVSGCGGGSTTNGAGSADFSAGFNITPYVGNWSGPINGPNVYGYSKLSLTVYQSGGVYDIRPDPQCPKGINGKFINSNPFKWVSQFKCFDPGLGVCTVTENGTLHLSGGNRIIGEYTQHVSCGLSSEPDFSNRGEFSLLKRSGSFQL